MNFTPIQLGLFFARTAFIVFAAGMLATKLAPRYGLDRPILAGLWATAASSVAILLISMIGQLSYHFWARCARISSAWAL